jgi:hypothetical protein
MTRTDLSKKGNSILLNSVAKMILNRTNLRVISWTRQFRVVQTVFLSAKVVIRCRTPNYDMGATPKNSGRPPNDNEIPVLMLRICTRATWEV